MNPVNIIQYTICTCGNSHLLTLGSHCEICMGLVCENTQWEAESRFTEAYFEELEEVIDAQYRVYDAFFGTAA